MKVEIIKPFSSASKKFKIGESIDLNTAKLPFVSHLMKKIDDKPTKKVKKTEKASEKVGE